MMLLREGGIERLLRRLRFVGDGTSETDHMNFIVRADDRRKILAVLLRRVDERRMGRCALQSDAGVVSQHPAAAGARSRSWLASGSADHAVPAAALPTSYDELLRSLPSRLRTSIRSARRDLEAKYLVEFGRYVHHEELPEALEPLYRNHAGRWQAKGEQGVFVSDRKRDFYAAAQRESARRRTSPVLLPQARRKGCRPAVLFRARGDRYPAAGGFRHRLCEAERRQCLASDGLRAADCRWRA